MYSDGLGWLLVLGSINIIWLAGLTFVVWQNRLFVKRLFPHQGVTFKDKLAEVLKEFASLEDFKKNNLKNIQKMALIRYNPYKDTGGDQSFSLSLLNGVGDGFVISSLHSRAGTRIFAKPVSEGKEVNFEFSKEEKEVINKALS